MSESRPFLRARDVALLLGVGVRQAQKLIRKGTIPSVRSGRSVLVPSLAWQAWLEHKSREALRSIGVTTSGDRNAQGIGDENK
jgi:excisionase family DNA binding protein